MTSYHNFIKQLMIFAKEKHFSLANFFIVKQHIHLLYGKRLLLNEVDYRQDIVTLLESFGAIEIIPGIVKRNRFFYYCNRCHNCKRKYFSKFACAKCQRDEIYCRKCAQLGVVKECSKIVRWKLPLQLYEARRNLLTWQGQLTKLQKYGSNRILKAIEDKGELLVWAVTGSGKTEMLFPSIQYCLQNKLRVCIATPRTDVVRELYPRLLQAFQNSQITPLYGGSKVKYTNAQCVIATTHQLLKYENTFDLIIVDEVDAFPYYMDEMLQNAVKQAKKEQATTIYLTATPRANQLRALSFKRLPAIFIPLRYHQKPLPIPKLYDKPFLKINKNIEKQMNHILSPYFAKRNNPQRQLLIFLPTIALAEKLTKPLNKLIEQYYGKDKITTFVTSESEDRSLIIERFRQREIYCLLTTTILERGVTFPSVDVLVLFAHHQVFDEQALVQISGRAGRSKDDPTGDVIFFSREKTRAIQESIKQIKEMNKRAYKMRGKWQ